MQKTRRRECEHASGHGVGARGREVGDVGDTEPQRRSDSVRTATSPSPYRNAEANTAEERTRESAEYDGGGH